MPYFIYKITPQTQKKLEYVCDFPKFKQAKQHVRSLREQLGPSSVVTVKIIFADSSEEAEARLLETRSAPILKEWEK